MKSSAFANLISNYGSRLWSLISVFIFIPLYIKYLGVESYAVIGFYALLLGVISFADAGLSSAITREFSMDSDSSFKFSLLRLTERVYIFVCVLIVVIIYCLSETIATQWLTSNTIPHAQLKTYIQLIGIGISIQLLSSLYFGALFGLNSQLRANALQVSWSIAKSLLVILAFIFIKANLYVYFLWQIACNLLYVILLRVNVILRLRNGINQLIFNVKKIPPHILRFIGGMMLVAIISSINLQIDKIIISSSFSLNIFGYYNIAATLAQIPMIVATPLAVSIFPLLSRHSNQTDTSDFQAVFTKSTFLLHSFLLPILFCIGLYTNEIVQLWIGSASMVNEISNFALLIKLLSLGSALLALQLLPYYLLLSKGKTRYTLVQGVIQVLIGIPLLYYSIYKFGIVGIGFASVAINLGGCIFLYIVIFSRYLTSSFADYLKSFILLPAVVTFSVMVAFYMVYKQTQLSFYFFIISSALISVAGNVVIYNWKNKAPLLTLKSHLKITNE